MRRSWVIPAAARDTLLFVTGLGLILYEALLRTGEPRASLLVVYAGMVGLPLVFRADDIRNDQ